MNEFITQELRRIINRIPTVDPTTSDYHMLMASLEGFYNTADMLEEIFDALDEESEDSPDEGRIIKVEFRPPVVPCSEDCATCDRCGGEEKAPDSSSNSTDSVTAGENPQENVEAEADPPSEKVDETSDESGAEPEETYDLITVRKALIDARKGGVDIKVILKSVGATNLTDLAPEKYGAVMAKLKELT